jgi:hypothetical protein
MFLFYIFLFRVCQQENDGQENMDQSVQKPSADDRNDDQSLGSAWIAVDGPPFIQPVLRG